MNSFSRTISCRQWEKALRFFWSIKMVFMPSVKPLLALLTFLIILRPHSSGQPAGLPETFPFSSPEQQGINSGTLDSMLLFIKETNQNIHHLTIIRNDHTVFDADFYPYSSPDLHDLASVSKSIT